MCRPRTALTLLAALALLAIAPGCGGSQHPPEEPAPTFAPRRLFRDTSPEVARLVRIPRLPPVPPYVLPYSTEWVLSDFWDCRPGRRRHAGLDLGGVGPLYGLGSPVSSMALARVTEVGRPEDDPRRYGRRLRDGTSVERGGEWLPVSGEHPDYGEVHYFTSDHGTAHTGVIVSTEILEGPLQGYRVRYMHLAEVRPGLLVGDVLRPGQELGLMGGTAILRSAPHVHMDLEDPAGNRVDLAPYLGIPTREGGDC